MGEDQKGMGGKQRGARGGKRSQGGNQQGVEGRGRKRKGRHQRESPCQPQFQPSQVGTPGEGDPGHTGAGKGASSPLSPPCSCL